MSTLDIMIANLLALDSLTANLLILLPLLIIAIASIFWFIQNLSDPSFKYDVKEPEASREILIVSIARTGVLRLASVVFHVVSVVTLFALATLLFYIQFTSQLTNQPTQYVYWPAMLVVTAMLAISLWASRYFKEKKSVLYDELAKMDDKSLESNQSVH